MGERPLWRNAPVYAFFAVKSLTLSRGLLPQYPNAPPVSPNRLPRPGNFLPPPVNAVPQSDCARRHPP